MAGEGQQLTKGMLPTLFKGAIQILHTVLRMHLMHLGTHFWEQWRPCDCKLYGKILLLLQWCFAILHPFSHSLPAGNQIASLTTNDLERHIFWCHLVLSFLALIITWLVAQETPIRAWQILGCKRLVEEKKTDREEKCLVWFENPDALRKKQLLISCTWCFSSLQGVEELTDNTDS